MAARLTDKQKKKIVADYIVLGSYRAAAKANGVSITSVKNAVLKSDDFTQKVTLKKKRMTPMSWLTWRASAGLCARL